MKCPSCHAETEEQAETCFSCGQSLTAVIKRGSVIASRYEILNALGKGGMGMVYKAHDRVLEEEIAFKVLRADVARSPDMARRFRSEIRLARKVTHRNVCRIHEYGEDQGFRYISMELIEGVDLKQVLRERKEGIPPKEAFEVSIQIAKGLQAIHDVGIVHRDLKTANIMRDGRGIVKLMDFGIAKEEGVATGATAVGDIVGTPEYMSPEQARGQRVDSRSDLYAMAIVIHEIFSGDVPFRGDTPIVTIFKHIQDQALLEGAGAPAFPAALVPVLRRGLAKDPNDRFTSADEVVDSLRSARAATFPDTPSQPPALSPIGPQADAPPPGLYVTPAPGPLTRPVTTPAPGSFPSHAVPSAAVPMPAPVPLASPPTPAPVTPTPLPARREVIDTAATHSIEPPTASFAQSPVAIPTPAPAPPPPAPAAPAAAPAPAIAARADTPSPPVQRPPTGRMPKAVVPPPGPPAEVRIARQQTQRLPAPVVVRAEPAPAAAEPPAGRRLLLPVLVIVPLLIMIAGGVLVVGRILRSSPRPSPIPAAEPTPSVSRATPGPATPQPRPSIAEEVITVPGATPTPPAGPRVVSASATLPVAPDAVTSSVPGPARVSPGLAAPGLPTHAPTPPVAVVTPQPTPRPTATAAPRPAEPTPEQLRAQQIATLLGQADAAWAGHKYDDAGRLYDEILKLEGGNARAAAGKARAQWAAAAIRRVFSLGRTIQAPVKAGKGPAGFDTDEVDVKSQDFLCDLAIEMSPAVVRPGDSYDYTAKVSLASNGKKSIKIKSIQANLTLDGALSSQPVTPLVKEVAKQAVSIAEVRGAWKDEMKSWNLKLIVTGDKGDACSNTISWK